jgi:hypothetical protein
MVWKPIAETVKRLGWRLAGRREGIASVEFAIVLPILVLMLFGAIEFGRLLVDYQVANKSVRDAVRYLSRVRDTAITGICPGGGYLWPPAKAIQPPTQQIRYAVNLAMTGSIDKPTVPSDYLLGYWVDPTKVEIQVIPPCTDNTTGTFSGAYQYSDYIPELEMTATVAFPSGFGWLLSFLDDFTITVTHNEVHIGD